METDPSTSAKGSLPKTWDGPRLLEFVHEHPEFNSEEFAQQHGRSHVVCLGDSHVWIFYYIRDANLMPSAWFDVYGIPGATAQGMVNPFSVSDAFNIFRRRLDSAETWQHLVFQLGEVDCGFLAWHRAEKHGISVRSQVETSVRNYGSFLGDVFERGFENVYVLSVSLPTILDEQDWHMVDGRKRVTATQRERTELTLGYNERLADACSAWPAVFVDVTSAQLDPSTGLVLPALINSNRVDRHLSSGPYAKILVEKLGPLLEPPAAR